jgi:hypothetical protein
VPCSGKTDRQTDRQTEGPTEFFEKNLETPKRKALPEFFLCIFSSLTCLKKPVFRKRDLLRWNVTATLSLFLKSEKIPALL